MYTSQTCNWGNYIQYFTHSVGINWFDKGWGGLGCTRKHMNIIDYGILKHNPSQEECCSSPQKSLQNFKFSNINWTPKTWSILSFTNIRIWTHCLPPAWFNWSKHSSCWKYNFITKSNVKMWLYQPTSITQLQTVPSKTCTYSALQLQTHDNN